LTIHPSFPSSDPPSTLLSVYDGHGGAEAAAFASLNLPNYLSDALLVSGGVEGDEEGNSVLLALSASYDKTDLELSKIGNKGEKDTSLEQGTCATTVLVRGGVIYSANVGDSSAYYYETLFGKIEAKELTRNHRCSNEEEAKRIKDAGGFIFRNRVNGTLAVTRALGHREEKEFIAGTPHLSRTETKEGGWVVVASDGVWDVVGKDEVGEIVKQGKEEGVKADEICQRIKDAALGKYGRDNIAVVVMFLK